MCVHTCVTCSPQPAPTTCTGVGEKLPSLPCLSWRCSMPTPSTPYRAHLRSRSPFESHAGENHSQLRLLGESRDLLDSSSPMDSVERLVSVRSRWRRERQEYVPPREHIAAANESEVVQVPAGHLQYAFPGSLCTFLPTAARTDALQIHRTWHGMYMVSSLGADRAGAREEGERVYLRHRAPVKPRNEERSWRIHVSAVCVHWQRTTMRVDVGPQQPVLGQPPRIHVASRSQRQRVPLSEQPTLRVSGTPGVRQGLG